MGLKIGEMQYRIERDIQALAKQALKVRDAIDDEEVAHIEEDTLHEMALVMIRHHAMRPDVKKLVSIALSTKDLDFHRWCS